MMDREAMALCGQYQIDVDVNSVMFWHHHLFSQEHVYASRITRLYEEYVSRMRKKTVEFLTSKVFHSDKHYFPSVLLLYYVWLSGIMVTTLDLHLRGNMFDSQLSCILVTIWANC